MKTNESYNHLYAKRLLLEWLIVAERDSDTPTFCGISWNKSYGIFSELPFHELDEVFYFESRYFDSSHPSFMSNPTAYNNNTHRGKILFIPDICIFSKGTPAIIIELVNTSPISDEKLDRIKAFYKGHHCDIYEVYSNDILKNTDVPSRINFKSHIQI